jgi:8-oxo-dGTP diphosphatase
MTAPDRRGAAGRDAPGTAAGRRARSGDGFLRCDDGHVRWGRFGAAGVLFVVRGDDGPEVLLQLRSAFAHEGSTWSCQGGAIDDGETTLEAALREATEEVGAPPEPWRVLGEHVFAPASDWRYTTAVVEVPRRFGVSANFETDEVRWCAPGEIDRLALHPGFAAAWPHLLAIVAPGHDG